MTFIRQDVVLAGCTPEPLMAYLKALGVFRLIAEQKDYDVRACWRNDVLVLHTGLDVEALTGFLMKEYRPTPIVAPWNGRFKTAIKKGDTHGMDAIRASNDERLRDYSLVIDQVTGLVDVDDKPSLLARCRNGLPDSVLPWLDAVYVLTADQPRYPPLLSQGGNVGTSASGDLAVNFMQNVVQALGLVVREKKHRTRGELRVNPQEWLEAALFADTSPPLTKGVIGQFNPGGVGGPNATSGFEGESLTNPWDFVLMMEGALAFAGAAARRLSAAGRVKAVFPFAVDTSAVGYGTAADDEYASKGVRGEMWMPLWSRPSSFGEVSHFLSEGRAQLGRRQAYTGTDFARSAVGLGVERGIGRFQRFGFLQRSGRDGVIATPIGRFRVRSQPDDVRRADLLFEVQDWIDRLRREAKGKGTPAELSRVAREIDRSIIEFCAYGGPRRLQEVLIALGEAENWVTKSRAKEFISPLPHLSSQWLVECDDDSPELRLAAAAASIRGEGRDDKRVQSVRANIAPVEFKGYWAWAADDTSVVWRSGDLLRSMVAVMERRIVEGTQANLDYPPVAGRIGAGLPDIDSFLGGEMDYQRIEALLRPLTAIRWNDLQDFSWRGSANPDIYRLIPSAYTAMKLVLLPSEFKLQPELDGVPIRFEPTVLARLRGGDVEGAFQIAARRLRSHGLLLKTDSAGIPQQAAANLAAALLFPIETRDMRRLAEAALVKPRVRE